MKLQAQETYAQAQRAQTNATVELNIALAELAQAAGTILDMNMVEASLSSVVENMPDVEKPHEEPEVWTLRHPAWE